MVEQHPQKNGGLGMNSFLIVQFLFSFLQIQFFLPTPTLFCCVRFEKGNWY